MFPPFQFFSALFLDLLLFRCWISWLDPLAFSFLFSTSLPFLLDSLEDFLQFYLHNLCTNFFYYFCHIFNLQELGTFSFYSFLGRFWVILEGGYLSEKVDIRSFFCCLYSCKKSQNLFLIVLSNQACLFHPIAISRLVIESSLALCASCNWTITASRRIQIAIS